jgi:anti-sigma B factor antagonist
MSSLDLRERSEGEITTLAPCGELDLSSAPKLEAAVQRLCADPTHEVILDLSNLTFVDTAGVSTLLTCRRLFEESDCGFWVMSPRKSVRRVLQRYGLVESTLFGNGWSPAS